MRLLGCSCCSTGAQLHHPGVLVCMLRHGGHGHLVDLLANGVLLAAADENLNLCYTYSR